jgi:hypothetical protein
LTLVRTDIGPPDEPDEQSFDGSGGWSGYAASPERRPR